MSNDSLDANKYTYPQEFADFRDSGWLPEGMDIAAFHENQELTRALIGLSSTCNLNKPKIAEINPLAFDLNNKLLVQSLLADAKERNIVGTGIVPLFLVLHHELLEYIYNKLAASGADMSRYNLDQISGFLHD